MEKQKLGIECKQLMAKEIKQRLESSSHIFITSFNAMPVSKQDSLRRKLKEINASLFIVKNRLARKIFQQLNFADSAKLMQGMTALALGGKDALILSKKLMDFAAQQENFKILGAYVDNEIIDLNSVKRLAAIPSKEVLLAQIVYGLKSPIQGLVNTLSGVMKRFVIVLDKIREKKEEGLR